MEFIVEGETQFRSLSLDKDVFLTTHVEEKVLSNGAIFTGEVDAVTGDIVHGECVDKALNERYEGPFVGGMRHGGGAVCSKLDGSKKFVGSYHQNCFEMGTLITKESTYTGNFGGGDFDNPIFHGKGLLAKSDQTVYEGEFHDNLYEGHGILTTEAQGRYDGSFSHGRKSGFGTIQYRDGGSYSGNWELDLKHGKGCLTSPKDSRRYVGEFQFDLPHGVGTLFFNDVEMKGSWVQGRPLDGSGWKIEFQKTGLVYKGDTVCGRPHGFGSLIRVASGISPETVILHSGQFLSGLPVHHAEIDHHDDGVQRSTKSLGRHAADDAMERLMHMSSGSDFRFNALSHDSSGSGLCHEQPGQWVDNILALLASDGQSECQLTKIRVTRSKTESSHATVTLLDESTYCGTIGEDGVMEGPAKFTDALSNSVFIGTFHRGLKHGTGCEQYDDGTIYNGTFRDGWRDGTGELLDTDGCSIYKGSWLNDRKHGKGICRYDDGSPYPGRYEGDMRDDQRHGRGTLITKCGCVCEGDWCNGVPQFGEWVITYPSASVYLGTAEFLDQVNPPVPTGFGSQREPDGTFFAGSFLNGLRHGEGLCLLPNGKTQEGKWEKGILVDG